MRQSNYDSEFCGNLPIHLTNLIQPYGVLLIINNDLHIIQASDNTQSVFSKRASDIVNQPLVSFIGDQAIAGLREKLSKGFNSKIPAVWEINGANYVVLIHRNPQYILAEIDVTPHKA